MQIDSGRMCPCFFEKDDRTFFVNLDTGTKEQLAAVKTNRPGSRPQLLQPFGRRRRRSPLQKFSNSMI